MDFFKILLLMKSVNPQAFYKYIKSTKIEKALSVTNDSVQLANNFIKNYIKPTQKIFNNLMKMDSESIYIENGVDTPSYFNHSSFFKDNFTFVQLLDMYDGMTKIAGNREYKFTILVDSQNPFNPSGYMKNLKAWERFLNSQYFIDKMDLPINQKAFENFVSKVFGAVRVKNKLSDYKELKSLAYRCFVAKNPNIEDKIEVEDVLINNLEAIDKYAPLMDFLDEGHGGDASVYQMKLYKSYVFKFSNKAKWRAIFSELYSNRFSKNQKLDLFFDIFSDEDFFKTQRKIKKFQDDSYIFEQFQDDLKAMKSLLTEMASIEGFDNYLKTEKGNKLFFLYLTYISSEFSLDMKINLDSFGDTPFNVRPLSFKNMSEALLSMNSFPMDICVYNHESSKEKRKEIYSVILDRFTNGKYYNEAIKNTFDKDDDLVMSFLRELKKDYSDKEIFNSFVLSYKHPYGKPAKEDKRIYSLRELNSLEKNSQSGMSEFKMYQKTHLFNEFLQKFMGDKPTLVWDLKKEAHPLFTFLENNTHKLTNGEIPTHDCNYFFDIEQVFLNHTKLKYNSYNYLSTDINNQTIKLDEHLTYLLNSTHRTVNSPYFAGFQERLKVHLDENNKDNNAIIGLKEKIKSIFKKQEVQTPPVEKIAYINGIYKEDAEIDMVASNRETKSGSGIHDKALNTYKDLMNLLNESQDLGLSVEVQMKAEKLMIDNLSFIKQIKNIEEILPMEIKHFYENSFNKYLYQSVSIYVNGMKKYSTMNSLISDKEKNIFSRMSNRELAVDPELFKEKIQTEAIRQLDLLEKELNHIEDNILTKLTNDSIKESNIQTRVLQERKEALTDSGEVNLLEANGTSPVKIVSRKI